MARGQVSKDTITAKLLEVFPGSFKYDKEIRIPMMEDGSEVQIKVTLTAAKTNVESGGPAIVAATTTGDFPLPVGEKVEIHATEEEKQNVQELMKRLGI